VGVGTGNGRGVPWGEGRIGYAGWER